MFGRRGRESEPNDEYHYIVHHDDGNEEVVLNLKDTESGWNFLGNFYFSPGPAMIEITNQSSGQIVVADAVKFVRQ